jgi:phosphomannomutase
MNSKEPHATIDRMSIFSSFDIRGRIDDSLTPEYAWNVGKAFAEWLPEEGHVTVVNDGSADQKIVHAVIEGVRLQGRAVVDGGQGDSQHLIELTSDNKPAGSVMISHDAVQGLEIIQLYQENGVALSSDNGLIDIAQLVEAANFAPAAVKGELL